MDEGPGPSASDVAPHPVGAHTCAPACAAPPAASEAGRFSASRSISSPTDRRSSPRVILNGVEESVPRLRPDAHPNTLPHHTPAGTPVGRSIFHPKIRKNVEYHSNICYSITINGLPYIQTGMCRKPSYRRFLAYLPQMYRLPAILPFSKPDSRKGDAA